MPVTIPPFTDVPAPGDPVASAWAQQLTQFAVDQIVAQPGTPTSPNTELWYDTDDAGMGFPNMPRGQVGRTVGTASAFSTSSNTSVDITVTAGQAPTLTLALDPTRIYRAVFNAPIIMSTVTDRAILELYINGVLNRTMAMVGHPTSAGTAVHATGVYYFVPSTAASVVYKMMARVSAGTLSMPFASATDPIEFVIEDVGAVGQSGGGVWSDSFPRGFVGQAVVTSNMGPYSTATDLPGMSVAFTAEATRRYKTSWKLRMTKDGTAAATWIELMNASNAVIDTSFQNIAASSEIMVSGFTVESGLSGAQTRKLNIKLVAGAVTVTCTAANKAILLVEDMGKV